MRRPPPAAPNAPLSALLDRLKAQRAEGDRVRAILQYLELVPGAVAWRQNVGGMKTARGQYVQFGFAGLPDINGWVVATEQRFGTEPGEHVWTQITRPLYIEVKREGGRRRAEQRAFVQRASAAGCLAFFATCVDDVRTEFKRAGVRCP